MSKYIIELDDRIKLVTSVGVTENGVVYTTSDYVHNLEELNSDYINEHYGELQETAYKKGLHDGESKCRYCNEYQRGLEDAWEAARKIFGYEIDGGIPIDKIGRVFGYSENETFCTADIIRHNTASEAIAKLKVYEDKQTDRIEVGDEVATETGKKYTVVSFGDGGTVCGFNMDGKWTGWKPKEVTKTGKHYDIASILEAMRK